VENSTEPKERFFKQALETFNNNDCEEGDTIDAFNRRVNKSGYCPTLTTRPEGFKTAILPVVKDDSEEVSVPKRKARTFDFDECKPICVGNTTPSGKSQCNAVYSTEGVSQTLCAGTHGYATGSILEETNKIDVVGNYMPSNHDASRVVSTDGVAPCVKENHGTVTGILEEQSKLNEINNDIEVVGIKQATKKGYIECELPGCADFSFPNSTKRRGRVQGGGQIVPTLTAAKGGIRYIENIYRIRKLTVRECFKLMSFEFEDWDKCAAIGISNSAGYKAAGNSICCCCISLLFEHLYKAQYDDTYICTDEKMQNFQNPETE
jgi:DNA (cytosine-5)-methyltransferase 1